MAQFGRYVGGIDQVVLRWQVLVDEGLLDIVDTHRFMHRRGGRMRVGEQVDLIGVARLAEVSHIPDPLGVAFVAITRRRIIGRFQALGRWRQVGFRLEDDVLCRALTAVAAVFG